MCSQLNETLIRWLYLVKLLLQLSLVDQLHQLTKIYQHRGLFSIEVRHCSVLIKNSNLHECCIIVKLSLIKDQIALNSYRRLRVVITSCQKIIIDKVTANLIGI